MSDAAPKILNWESVATWVALLAGLGKLVPLPRFVRALHDDAAFLVTAADPVPLAPEWLAAAARFVALHLGWFATFWMLLGLLMIVAAFLWRRARWARGALLAVCCFGFVEAPLVAAFLAAVRRMLLASPAPEARRLAVSLVPRIWVSLAWLGVYAILFVLLTARAPSREA